MRFRFQQLTRRGMWTSADVFESDYDGIVLGVRNGHLIGQPRAAVEVATGRVIYAVDAEGHATAASEALFETLVHAA